MRKIIIAGNWKMYKTSLEAIELVTLLKREVVDNAAVDIVVCPPFTALADVRDTLSESNVGLGAQNLYWEDSGAFTGEVSAPMLKDLGVAYVIIGHSERRQFFGETDETVNKKIRAALHHGLLPIVCIGESLAQREQNRTMDVIRTQCEGSLKGLTEDEMRKLIIAYEPVWAIGTGKTATPQQAQEVHKFIRELLGEMFGSDCAAGVRIQYGGSVKPENTKDLMSQPDIDGALVGGASLKSDSFSLIIKNSSDIKK
ncbi:MAG TPA: triose-phosphate isomerase [Candidatus Omnitrophota bacterium]|jgi:triosephosphate isomerase|nr:triose-phosphate isomerase [Candidatus Omnitrophota bacterium]